MTRILFLKGIFQRNQYRCNYLTKEKHFCQFFSAFLKSRLSFEEIEKKDGPRSLCISEIPDYERHG